MVNEHLPSAAELIRDPDGYRTFYVEQLAAAQVTANGARIMLRKIDVLTREYEEIEGYRANGFPTPRPHTRRPDAEAEAEAAESVPVTRKPQVLALLGQDPGQEWSVRQIGETLGIENHKSLRVTLDEMAKAGTLIKTPEARYQFAGEEHTE
jgi:hypothetical protein